MAFKIEVIVKPNAKKSEITKISETEYRVAVKAPAQEGKANRAVIDLIAESFSVPKSSVTIVRGHSVRKKLIEIA
jgi:uncharacterized protein (TIGR00251 family)